MKEEKEKPGKKQKSQMSFSSLMTPSQKVRNSPPGGLDKGGNICHTKPTMNTNTEKAKLPQQLRNPDVLLWREVKATAAMEGKTMTQWVEEACRTQLALTKKSKKEAK